MLGDLRDHLRSGGSPARQPGERAARIPWIAERTFAPAPLGEFRAGRPWHPRCEGGRRVAPRRERECTTGGPMTHRETLLGLGRALSIAIPFACGLGCGEAMDE